MAIPLIEPESLFIGEWSVFTISSNGHVLSLNSSEFGDYVDLIISIELVK